MQAKQVISAFDFSILFGNNESKKSFASQIVKIFIQIITFFKKEKNRQQRMGDRKNSYNLSLGLKRT